MKQSKLDQKDMEQTSQNWYSVFVPWDLNQVSLDELFLILCHLWRPFGNDFRPLKRLLSQHQHTPTPLELHLKGDMETKIPQTKRQSNWTSRLKKTEMKIAPIQNVADIFMFFDEKKSKVWSILPLAPTSIRVLRPERVNWSSGGFTGRLLQLDVSNMISVFEDIRWYVLHSIRGIFVGIRRGEKHSKGLMHSALLECFVNRGHPKYGHFEGFLMRDPVT